MARSSRLNGRGGGGWIRLGWMLGMWMVACGMLNGVQAEEHSKVPLPSYHYGAHIQVSCLNRSM
jgi:hypothetical protein